MQVAPEQRDQARRVDLGGEQGRHDGHGHEDEQQQQGDARVPLGEQNGHGDHGTELTDGADRKHDRAEAGAQDPGVPEDREQRAERRRREAQPDDDRVQDETRGLEHGTHPQGDAHGARPRHGGTAQVPPTHGRHVELPARNIRYVRPKSDSAVTMEFGWASPRT